MKTAFSIIAALIVGLLAATWIFSASFMLGGRQLLAELSIPLGVLALVSFALGSLQRTHVWLLASILAGPTLILAAAVSLMLAAEGRADAGWVLLASACAASCAAGAVVARRFAR